MSGEAMPAARIPWLGVGALAFGIGVALLSPFDVGRTEIAQTLENAAHAPLFAVVALCVLAMYRQVRPHDSLFNAYVMSFAIAVGLGALGEIVQGLIGRDAEFGDILNDACGALAALSWRARREQSVRSSRLRRRLTAGAIIVAGIVVAAPIAKTSVFYLQRWRQLPELATWNTRLGNHFVRNGWTPASVAELPARFSKLGELALQVRSADGNWVGVNIEEPGGNWRDYAYLELDLANPTTRPLELFVRIEDRDHNMEYNDRFNKTLSVAPETRQTLRIAIGDIENGPTQRRLNLDKIARVVLFQDGRHGTLSYYICGVRLAH